MAAELDEAAQIDIGAVNRAPNFGGAFGGMRGEGGVAFGYEAFVAFRRQCVVGLERMDELMRLRVHDRVVNLAR